MRVSYARADDPNATVADAAHEGFRPDATSLFVSKGALLKLGEITLPADAVLNLTAAQLVDPGSLLGGKVAPEAEKVLGGLAARINEAVPPRGNTADPAIGDAWNVPTHNRPSGEAGCCCLGGLPLAAQHAHWSEAVYESFPGGMHSWCSVLSCSKRRSADSALLVHPPPPPLAAAFYAAVNMADVRGFAAVLCCAAFVGTLTGRRVRLIGHGPQS